MTCWAVVAARPPHSSGHRMAAQRPSLSLFCHALRLSITPMTPRATSASSLSDHCSMNGGISLSRNASSSSLKATSSGDHAKSIRNLTLPSGRRYGPRFMDFVFSPEQEALRDAVRAFLASEAPIEYVRRMAEHDDAGVTPEVWRKIVDLGWTGLLVPESAGGLGLGMVDAVVIQEEMGRALFPGPFFSSAILATLAARALGLDDQLAELAEGTERGTVAFDEAGYGDPIERVHVRAAGRGTRYKLDGVKPMVPDGSTANWALVPARTREGIQTFLIDDCDATPVTSLDVTRKFARYELDQTRATLVGPPGDHADIWRRVMDDAGVLIGAELIGV